jgi:hypothetical protein
MLYTNDLIIRYNYIMYSWKLCDVNDCKISLHLYHLFFTTINPKH